MLAPLIPKPSDVGMLRWVGTFATICSCASVSGYKDMRCNGSTLAEILAAGEWKSAAFLRCYVVVGVGFWVQLVVASGTSIPAGWNAMRSLKLH